MGTESYRKRENLTLAAFAGRLGLRSRGYLHSLETGRQKWPLELALKVEAITAGQVTAAQLRPDLAPLLRSPAPAGAPPTQLSS